MIDIKQIQTILQLEQLDGWLFTDFHGRDQLTRDFLSMDGRPHSTRRMFYYIPAQGSPVKLLSAIEPLLLDHLPGIRQLFKGRQEMEQHLHTLLLGKCVASQYSPVGNIPTISTMEAGLAELLQELGAHLVSSANILQYFYAMLTQEQIETHKEAGRRIESILYASFHWIRQQLNAGLEVNEWLLRSYLSRRMLEDGLETDGMPPFLGVDAHATDPGYEPSETDSTPILEGSRLIIDIAGRLNDASTLEFYQRNGMVFASTEMVPPSIYYDISWCMQVGTYDAATGGITNTASPDYTQVFSIAKEARDQAVALIQTSLDSNQPICGYEVDQQTRRIFQRHGVEAGIMHRTGHSIGHTCHGMGANLDDYETHDERYLLPNTMFSVEPGIYLDEIGVRTEFNVHITKNRKAVVYGTVQDEILVI